MVKENQNPNMKMQSLELPLELEKPVTTEILNSANTTSQDVEKTVFEKLSEWREEIIEETLLSIEVFIGQNFIGKESDIYKKIKEAMNSYPDWIQTQPKNQWKEETGKSLEEEEFTNFLVEILEKKIFEEKGEMEKKILEITRENEKLSGLSKFQEEIISELNKDKSEEENLITQKIQESEQSKNQLQTQHQNEKNQLRDKINTRLENSFLFRKNEKGETLEQAINNLLEKRAKWDEEVNKLQTKISQINSELKKEKSRLETLEAKKEREKKEAIREKEENFEKEKKTLRKRIDHALSRTNLLRNRESKSLNDAINEIIAVKIEGQQYLPTRAQQFCNATGMTWASNKIGTGLTIAGIMTVTPTIFGALGYLLKLWLTMKTGGNYGAAMAGMNQIGNNNFPPQQLGTTPPNLPPVINNYHYNSPKKKKKPDTS